jgi:hypothetical protein
MFARWCEVRRTPFCPASPAAVASFVNDCATLGISQIWAAVQDISRLHASAGLADPTLGHAVVTAISAVAGIEPPRSWPDQQKRSFKLLPYDIQLFIAAHEQRREKALRRAQNDAAAARREIKIRETSPTHPDKGAETDEPAASADA